MTADLSTSRFAGNVWDKRTQRSLFPGIRYIRLVHPDSCAKRARVGFRDIRRLSRDGSESNDNGETFTDEQRDRLEIKRTEDGASM